MVGAAAGRFRGELELVCLGDLVRESASSDIVPDVSVFV